MQLLRSSDRIESCYYVARLEACVSGCQGIAVLIVLSLVNMLKCSCMVDVSGCQGVAMRLPRCLTIYLFFSTLH